MDGTLALAKRSLRREMSTRRRSLAAEQRDSASAAIAVAVLSMSEYEHASRVVAYVALPDEASLEAVLHGVLESGRALLLPRVAATGLVFAAIPDLERLQKSPSGIWEPPVDPPRETLSEGDLILVPGLAFDRHGGRLGRGAGHYDRSLPPELPVFGVGFSFQLIDAVPVAPHDRRMDGIVTELGVVRTAPGDREPDPG